MTTPPDLPDRDPALERAWREHSQESPPPALDRAILAAAHRAVDSKPHVAQVAEATSPQRWWMPLAAAATIGAVVIGILQTMPTDSGLVLPDAAPPGAQPQRTEKLAATAPGASARESKDEAASDTLAAKKKLDAAALPASTVAARTPVSPAPMPAPAVAPAPAPMPAAAPPPATAPMSAPPPPPRPAEAPAEQAARAAPVPRKASSDAREMPDTTPMQSPAPTSTVAEAGRANLARAPEPFPAAPQTERKDAPASGGARATADSAEKAPHGESGPEADVPKRESMDRQRALGAAAAPGVAGRLQQAAPAPPAPAAFAARDEMREAAPKPLAKTAADADAQAKARDPDAWITRIRKLRDEGNTADALRELREFRDKVPDAERRLPADLRDWAAALRP